MSGNRKMLRDQVRKHLKKAKKSIPAEYRDSITFSSVFNIVKSSANDAPSKPTEQGQDESSHTEQKVDI